jgi:uncharacterized membrane protein YhaH (DUF805 family)
MHALALAHSFFQTDSTPDAHANMMAGIGVGMVLFFVLLVLAILGFMIFCLWRIFTKAGLSGALSFLIFIPGFGGLIVLCILAFMDWKVVPVVQNPYYAPPPPPSYPPAPTYPPAPPTL